MHHHFVSAVQLANRLTVFAVLTALLALLGATKAAALEASTSLITVDTPVYTDVGLVLPAGGGILFNPQNSLAPDDTDSQRDVYLDKDGAVSFLTPGIAESVDLSLLGASDDGTKLFVESTGLLDASSTAVDVDGSGTDIWEISGGTPKLISRFNGVATDNTTNFMDFGGVSADGTKVFFVTDAQMNIADQDGGGEDVYMRDTVAGTTTLISTNTGDTANANVDASFCGASASGEVVAFDTPEAMDAGDTDSAQSDTYKRVGSTTTFESTGPLGGGVAGDAECRDVSRDGTTVAFDSKAQLFSADDATGKWDVFTRSGGATRWVSTSALNPATIYDSRYADMSADGLIVHFNTAVPLVAEDSGVDTDDTDGYSSKPGGIVTLETGGSLSLSEGGAQTVGVSSDGISSVLFSSNDKYVAGDTDEEESDLYVKAAGAGYFQASTGPADLDGPFGVQRLFPNNPNHRWTMSADGRTVGFVTPARLVSEDTDSDWDVYAFKLREPSVVPPPAADVTAPSISGAKLSNKSFAVDKKVRALSAARTKKGTKISFTLSEAASVKLAFSSVRGSKKKLVKTAGRSGAVGANSVKFGGRIGNKTLSPGKYQVKITATDAAGNVSGSKTLRFTIVKR